MFPVLFFFFMYFATFTLTCEEKQEMKCCSYICAQPPMGLTVQHLEWQFHPQYFEEYLTVK